jgi:hypothetical protein
MKCIIPFVLGVLAAAGAVAQPSAEIIARALAAAPRQLREGATIIQWKADSTCETLKKGTNRLVCYDRSGEPGRQPFAVQCTSIGNLDRVAQNRKFEAMTDKAAKQAVLDAAEADGTRSKPEIRIGLVRHEWRRSRARSNTRNDCGTGRNYSINRIA